MAVVGQDILDLKAHLSLERQHLVVQHGHSGFRLFGDVQEAEGKAAVDVDNGVHR